MNICDWCEMPLEKPVCDCNDCKLDSEMDDVRIGDKKVTFCSELCANSFVKLMDEIENTRVKH